MSPISESQYTLVTLQAGIWDWAFSLRRPAVRKVPGGTEVREGRRPAVRTLGLKPSPVSLYYPGLTVHGARDTCLKNWKSTGEEGVRGGPTRSPDASPCPRQIGRDPATASPSPRSEGRGVESRRGTAGRWVAKRRGPLGSVIRTGGNRESPGKSGYPRRARRGSPRFCFRVRGRQRRLALRSSREI